MTLRDIGNAPYIEAIYALDGMAEPLADGFETEFIEGYMRRIAMHADRTFFSTKQRRIIRDMVEKYLGKDRANALYDPAEDRSAPA